MRVKVDFTGASLRFGPPKKVLDLTSQAGTAYTSYDIAPDGRVIVIKQAATPPEVHVVLNWNVELARLVPTK